VLDLVEEQKLVCELVAVGFGFGRIGVHLYQDESYPGVGLEYLFTWSENHLSPDDFPWVAKPTKGNVHEEAWTLFNKVAGTPRNVERLKAHGLRLPNRVDLSY